jgi:hypothetical protein
MGEETRLLPFDLERLEEILLTRNEELALRLGKIFKEYNRCFILRCCHKRR